MDRRTVLTSVGALILAGCSETNSPPNSESTQATVTNSPTEKAFPVEVSKSVTIEVGEYHHIELNLPKRGELRYQVRGNTDFDVYLFEDDFDSGWDIYQEYQEGKTDETDDGRIGISDENADGEAEAGPSPLAKGTYHFVVDHTDYGGLDGAKPDSEAPALEAQIDLQVEKQGF